MIFAKSCFKKKVTRRRIYIRLTWAQHYFKHLQTSPLHQPPPGCLESNPTCWEDETVLQLRAAQAVLSPSGNGFSWLLSWKEIASPTIRNQRETLWHSKTPLFYDIILHQFTQVSIDLLKSIISKKMNLGQTRRSSTTKPPLKRLVHNFAETHQDGTSWVATGLQVLRECHRTHRLKIKKCHTLER